jgi:hypothetical protein
MRNMKQKFQVLFFVFIVLGLMIPVSAGDSISTDIITPAIAAPGEIISFTLIVTNLATVILDHCNYFFSVGPYVDLIQDCFGNPIEEASHVNSISDTLAQPPPSGTNHFLSMPVLGKIRDDAPPNAIITSSFQMEIISNEGPDGEPCAGCWADSASVSKLTVVDPPPVPAPEFPNMVIPGIFLTGLTVIILIGKKYN